MDYHYCEYEVYDRDYPEFTSQWTFGGLYTAVYTGLVQFDYPSPSSFGLFCPRVLHQGTELLYNPGAGSQTDIPNRIIITWMVLLCFCGVEYIGGLLGIMAVFIFIIQVSLLMILLVLALTDYHYVETPSAIYEDEGDDAYVCMWCGNYGGGPIVSHAGSEPSYAGLFNQSRDQLTSLRVYGTLAGSRQ